MHHRPLHHPNVKGQVQANGSSCTGYQINKGMYSNLLPRATTLVTCVYFRSFRTHVDVRKTLFSRCSSELSRPQFHKMKAKGKKLKRWPKHGSSSSNPSERRFREAAKNRGFKSSGLYLLFLRIVVYYCTICDILRENLR